MNKTLLFVVLFFTMVLSVEGQVELKDQLTKHVYTLAADSLKGREAGTIYAGKALLYIKQELEKAGLNPYVQTLEWDSVLLERSQQEGAVIPSEGIEEDDYVKEGVLVDNTTYLIGKAKNLYCIIRGNDSKLKDEYIFIRANYGGNGVDTIKKNEIIKNSANDNASGVASLIEIAKKLKANETLLKRSVVIVFTGDYNTDIARDYFLRHFKEVANQNNAKIRLGFSLSCLGTMEKQDTSNTYALYTTPYALTNAEDLVNKIIAQDKDFQTSVIGNDYYDYYDYTTEDRQKYTYPYYVYVKGDDYVLSNYEDEANKLDYDFMTKATRQIYNVVYAFDTVSQIEINKAEVEEPYGSKIFKHNSYFGINAMIGTNKHFYTKGKMTGKEALAYSFGLFYKLQLNNYLALKLDCNYERAYANRNDGRFSSDVISVPLSFMFATGGKAISETMIGFGPYCDYTFAGKLNKQKISFDRFNHYEGGIQWSAIVRINRFMFGVYQKFGLTDFMKEDGEDGKILNRNTYFTLGYRF